MIDGIGGSSCSPSLAAATALAPKPVKPGDPATAAATVSAPTSTLSRIAKDLSASPPVDTAKVASLKAAIAAGRYTIDPDAIAAKMIALETPIRA